MRNGPIPFRTQAQRKANAQSRARHERDNELARARIKLRAFSRLAEAVEAVDAFCAKFASEVPNTRHYTIPAAMVHSLRAALAEARKA